MRWLIAAGGTGGHVFPALSLAQEVTQKDPTARVLFVGTPRGLEARVVPAKGFALKTVSARGLMGMGWMAVARTLLGLPWVAFRCALILARFRPHIVVGMGGYVAGPVVFLAALWGLPTAIAEQNTVAGRTNRFLGRFVDRVFLSFPEAMDRFFESKAVVTGNPVREELVEASSKALPPAWEGKPGDEFHLLIFGGSQGARAINEAMVEALPMLERFPFSLQIVHQAGKNQVEALRRAYGRSGLGHRVVDFIESMQEVYLWAHLVICRAGAASLAEIALFGLPSILIPFPHAVDDHQRENAKVFQAAGASVMVDQRELSGASLAQLVAALAGDPGRLKEMAAAARRLARPRAAAAMVEECMALVGKKGCKR